MCAVPRPTIASKNVEVFINICRLAPSLVSTKKRNQITLHAAKRLPVIFFTNSPVQSIRSCFLSHCTLRVWKKANKSCWKTPIGFRNNRMQLLIISSGARWSRRTCTQRCGRYQLASSGEKETCLHLSSSSKDISARVYKGQVNYRATLRHRYLANQ